MIRNKVSMVDSKQQYNKQTMRECVITINGENPKNNITKKTSA
jgi:hypothetical protein